VGSLRRDLIIQFLPESMLITVIAAILSLAIVQIALPSFNLLTRCRIDIPWASPLFWGIMAGYVLVTGLLAGSRPAFYLSSFKPVKVLKGMVRIGRGAGLPRKLLYAKDRAVLVQRRVQLHGVQVHVLEIPDLLI
jgi:hypothetical protein